MANFRFEAADAQGAIQRGTLVADSARSARAQLRAQGLTALELREGRRRGQIELFGPRLSDSDRPGPPASSPACWPLACRWKPR